MAMLALARRMIVSFPGPEHREDRRDVVAVRGSCDCRGGRFGFNANRGGCNRRQAVVAASRARAMLALARRMIVSFPGPEHREDRRDVVAVRGSCDITTVLAMLRT